MLNTATAARIQDLLHFAHLADMEGDSREATALLNEVYLLDNDAIQRRADERDLAEDRRESAHRFLHSLLEAARRSTFG